MPRAALKAKSGYQTNVPPFVTGRAEVTFLLLSWAKESIRVLEVDTSGEVCCGFQKTIREERSKLECSRR